MPKGIRYTEPEAEKFDFTDISEAGNAFLKHCEKTIPKMLDEIGAELDRTFEEHMKELERMVVLTGGAGRREDEKAARGGDVKNYSIHRFTDTGNIEIVDGRNRRLAKSRNRQLLIFDSGTLREKVLRGHIRQLARMVPPSGEERRLDVLNPDGRSTDRRRGPSGTPSPSACGRINAPALAVRGGRPRLDRY